MEHRWLEICRKLDIAEQTFCRWNKRCVCVAIDHTAGRRRFSGVKGTRWLLTDEKRIDRFVGEIAHFGDCAEGTNLPTRTLVHEDRYGSSPLGRSAED